MNPIITSSSEINALLSLIDDPDDEVFQTVTQRFIGLGKDVIPYLEDFSIGSSQKLQTSKARYIIDRIALHSLREGLLQWSSGEENSMLEAALNISSYLDSDFDRAEFVFEIEKFRKSIWLELNSYLTPLEEINIINKIIFDYFKIKGIQTQHNQWDDYSPVQLFRQKKSNTYPLGALYLMVSEMLGISLQPIEIPRQNLLAYVDNSNVWDSEQSVQVIFYVDPLNGQVYTHKDIENYLKKTDHALSIRSLSPCSNKNYIQNWLHELGKCAKEEGKLHVAEDLDKIKRELDD